MKKVIQKSPKKKPERQCQPETQTTEQSKQRNIVQMLKELRTASDSEVSGFNPDTDNSSNEK